MEFGIWELCIPLPLFQCSGINRKLMYRFCSHEKKSVVDNHIENTSQPLQRSLTSFVTNDYEKINIANN
ncbi:11500_t:CDS:2 [Entrophospora sp. SA101]|nr:11500_t:CDS:2 [Entrophospora sp. SA101]